MKIIDFDEYFSKLPKEEQAAAIRCYEERKAEYELLQEPEETQKYARVNPTEGE